MIRSFGKHKPRLHPSAFVHDSAEIIGRVAVGRAASIWPGASLRGDVASIEIGPESNVQDLAVFHGREGRPVKLGRGVTVGHGAIVHGATVGRGCLIGMGAVVMEASISPECLVAAGAVVLAGTRIAARSLVAGVPAKAVRKLSAREVQGLWRSARTYVALARRHRSDSRIVFTAPGRAR